MRVSSADTTSRESTEERIVLDKEVAFFNKNRRKLLAKHEGRYVVICEQRVLGVYDDKWEAIKDTSQSKGKKMGTFLVRRVTEKDEVVVLRSRVRVVNGR